jgi:hypothetical protein
MFRRPIKLNPSTRAIAILPGGGLSHRHTEESRIVRFNTPASHPALTTSSLSEKDWSEWLWLGLIMFSIAAVAAVQVMQ